MGLINLRDGAARTAADTFDKHVAARLRLRRLQVGIAERAAARRFGVSVRKLARLEAGEIPIQAEWLDVACDLFGVRLSYFFRGMPSIPGAEEFPRVAAIGEELERPLSLASCLGRLAGAEVSKVTIARQPGFGFLPLVVMQERRLVEKRARAAGLGDLTVHYVSVNHGTMVNDGLLSGRVQVGAGGIPPFLTLWDRTQNTMGVKALSALGSSPQYLLTRTPGIRTVADFSDRDRINVLAPKATLSAVLLEMAAARTFGLDHYNKLDRLTVGLSQVEAVTQLVSGNGGITADFIGAPFAYQELDTPGIRLVLRTEDLLGGPSTNHLLYTTSTFYRDNPKTVAAIMAALDEAIALVRKDRREASEAFLKIEHNSPIHVSRMVDDQSIRFTTNPRGLMKYAGFMHQTGSINAMPANWQDLFFSAEAEKLSGD
ncbi:MAG: helix-turn-helix domain-containing protein [Stellaceae bacterium]